ncbi:hypothetical protein C5167_012091 [Papaver somniferum]|uniref:Uncharacterized protein n=1 Tax=Papaver somniferum TaxID=3469 RepID=A0A4Y7J0F6_PAPSO|nr:hypothetical protein C5167_012091 [Papaver somniferum]
MSCLLSCCASLSCGLCTSVASGISGRSARLGYCGLFGLSLITSWILREVGAPLLEYLPFIPSLRFTLVGLAKEIEMSTLS